MAKSKLPKSIRPEEFKKLIKVIPDKDKVSKVAFLLSYGSGLRISEIFGRKKGLSKCCSSNLIRKKIQNPKYPTDEDKKVVRYFCLKCEKQLDLDLDIKEGEEWKIKPLENENIREKSIEIWNAKGGSDRVVPLPKGWKKWMSDILPLTSYRGSTIRSVERKFKKYSKQAGLADYYTFHSLRHGFATRLTEAGVPINQVQLLMGHSNASTTSVYTRARPQDALKSYEDLF